jgi:hypothetical protein
MKGTSVIYIPCLHYKRIYNALSTFAIRGGRVFLFICNIVKAGGAGGWLALLPEHKVSLQLFSSLRRRRQQNRQDG